MRIIRISIFIFSIFVGNVYSLDKISMDSNTFCEAKNDTLRCIGRNESGSGVPLYEFSKLVDFTSNYYATCAIEDKKIVCFGRYKSYPNLSKLEFINPTKIAQNGYNQLCVIDFVVKCFDLNGNFLDEVSQKLSVKKPLHIYSTESSFCSVGEEQIKCIGNSESMNILQSTNISFDTFVMGDYFVCGAGDVAGISCWGEKKSTETKIIKNIPSELNKTKILQLASSERSICAVTKNKTYCWDSTGLNLRRMQRINSSPKFSKIQITDAAVCLVREGKTYCVEDSKDGNLKKMDLQPLVLTSNVLNFHMFNQNICIDTLDSFKCLGESFLYNDHGFNGSTNITNIESVLNGFCYLENNNVRCSKKAKLSVKIKKMKHVDSFKIIDLKAFCYLSKALFQCLNLETGESIELPPLSSKSTKVKVIRSGYSSTLVLNLSQANMTCLILDSSMNFVLNPICNKPKISDSDDFFFSDSFYCVLKEDRLSCFDTANDSNISLPQNFQFARQITHADNNFCTTDEEEIVCGHISDKSFQLSTVPKFPGLVEKVFLGVGKYGYSLNSCAITINKKVKCWGDYNNFSQIVSKY